MCQRRRRARASLHQATLAEAEILYDSTVASDQQSLLPPSSPPPIPPSPSPPLLPAVARPVSRRLTIVIQPQAADIAMESPPRLDSTGTNPASPTVNCSQFRLQQYQEQNGQSQPPPAAFSPYPTPPAAPPKDDYIPPSDSDGVESECAINYDAAPAAKVFHRGQLHIHKSYTGREPVGFVDTGLYEGGQHDWYEAYSEADVRWASRLDYVLRRHKIPRWRSTSARGRRG
jgi:hypothetical protein